MQQKKILAVASAGGHWKQLTRLRPAFIGSQVVYVSTLQQATPDGDKLYLIPDANRQNLRPFLPQIVVLAKILWQERPDCIVTTGAAPGLIALTLGRLIGVRGVWIDSFANVQKLSLSGRLARRVARLYLTQWEHLASSHGPFFAGSVL